MVDKSPSDVDRDRPKVVTAYCEPWSVRAGQTVRLMASRSVGLNWLRWPWAVSGTCRWSAIIGGAGC